MLVYVDTIYFLKENSQFTIGVCWYNQHKDKAYPEFGTSYCQAVTQPLFLYVYLRSSVFSKQFLGLLVFMQICTHYSSPVSITVLHF